MSSTLQPHGLTAALQAPLSMIPTVCSNSCPLSWWCYPTISSSTIPFFFSLQTFPASRSFSVSYLFCIRWPKYWSFSFNISPSNEYSGLISFRIDWSALLAVQGTPKSFLQHRSSKPSVLWCSAFFMVQLSHPYMATGKTVAVTIRTFVGKVMFLLFNMLSILVIISPQGVCVFEFHGCSHCLQWFWSHKR